MPRRGLRPEGEVVHYDDVAPFLRTGDLALFHGNSWISRGIQRATRSPYSHIGMVVRYGDVKEFGAGEMRAADDSEVYFFESMLARESLPDLLDPVWDGEHQEHEIHSGVQLVSLRDAFCSYDSQRIGSFSIRQLDIGDDVPLDYERLRKLMDSIDKKPYPNGAVVVAHWIQGNLGIKSALNNFFCAELVALCYEALGLIEIDQRRPANKYSPAAFSSRSGILDPRLQSALSPEQIVVVDDCPEVHKGVR